MQAKKYYDEIAEDQKLLADSQKELLDHKSQKMQFEIRKAQANATVILAKEQNLILQDAIRKMAPKIQAMNDIQANLSTRLVEIDMLLVRAKEPSDKAELELIKLSLELGNTLGDIHPHIMQHGTDYEKEEASSHFGKIKEKSEAIKKKQPRL